MSKCAKCGGNFGDVIYEVWNEFPVQGFYYNTNKFICKKCQDKFRRYITKKYEEFFAKESDTDAEELTK